MSSWAMTGYEATTPETTGKRGLATLTTVQISVWQGQAVCHECPGILEEGKPVDN